MTKMLCKMPVNIFIDDVFSFVCIQYNSVLSKKKICELGKRATSQTATREADRDRQKI